MEYYESDKHFLKKCASKKTLNLHVLNKNKLKKVNPFQKECITTDENKLPETTLVIPRPIPKTNNGGISNKLKCAKANIKADIIMPRNFPKSLDKMGSKTPRNIISSNSGAKRVVVKNNKINAK